MIGETFERELQQRDGFVRMADIREQRCLGEFHVENFRAFLGRVFVEHAERGVALVLGEQQARRAAADDEASARFGEAGVTLEREIRAAFALGDGREVEECLGRLRGRADQTTETAPGFGQVAHLVGELAQPQIRFTADGRIFAHALEFLARFVDAIEAHQGVDVGEAFGFRIECRRFLCNGDCRNSVAFGREHSCELCARRAGSRLVGEHAVGKLVRGSEIERLERQVDARGEQPFGDLGRIEPGPQGFQCDGGTTGIADFTHELDERLVAAQGLRAQDCC